MQNKRKYIVTYGVTTRQVYPTNDADLEYEWKPSDGNINLDLSLKTKLAFYNNPKKSIDDYTFLHEIESESLTRCDDVLIEIFKLCGGLWVSEYKGKLQLISGDWDSDKCTVILDVLGNNNSDCINIYKKKTIYPLAQFTFNNPAVGCMDDLGIYGYSGGSYYFLDIGSLVAATYPTFHKKINLAGTHYNAGFGTFYNICRNIVKEMLVNCGRDASAEMLRSDFFDWNAVGDTTGYIASALPPLPESEPRPAGTNREWYLPKTPGTNYVTGQTNRLTHLIYIPKSNARNVGSTTYWETGVESSGLVGPNRLTFADIELIWSTMFEAYWFMDADGCMRVEHISWFKNNATVYNSTVGAHAEYNKSNNKYSYNQGEMYEKEIFKFGFNASALNGSFDGGYFPAVHNGYNEIVYSGTCINLGTEKVYNLPKVETDMEMIDSAGSVAFDNYNNDGIFMCSIGTWGAETTICTTGGYTVKRADGNMHFTLLNTFLGTNVQYVTDGSYFNAHLQWYFLFRTYLRDNRILSQGDNGPATLALTEYTKRTKSQKNIILINCCDDTFDANRAQIITHLGTANISQATFNTKTNQLKITALHD